MKTMKKMGKKMYDMGEKLEDMGEKMMDKKSNGKKSKMDCMVKDHKKKGGM